MREDDVSKAKYLVADTSALRAECPDMPKRIKVFDTTLRDGEQTPGVNLTSDEKYRTAMLLDSLGVDVIEAGFPASSAGEVELFKRLSDAPMSAKICALARASTPDIDAALSAGANYVHVFIATSDIHMKYKLKMSREEVLDRAVKSVEYVKAHGLPAEFSCEDATRSDPEFIKQVYMAVEDAGADMLNVPDTVGASTPRTVYRMIREIRGYVKKPISMHMHNDFGLAVANTLAGVEAGAQQIQVTVNGVGERAGNASLEEAVMALRLLYGIETNIQTEKLFEASQFVAKLFKVWPSPNKAIVGENAFAHTAGIHVHGIQANALTYEPFLPELVGQKRRILFGKLIGTSAVKAWLGERGIKATEEEIKAVTGKIKEIGDRGRGVRDLELMAIIDSVTGRSSKQRIALKQLLVTTGTEAKPTARITLSVDSKEIPAEKSGDGPVDAALNAIESVPTPLGRLKLKEYHLDPLTGGSDALCEVYTTLQSESGEEETGYAVGPDIVITSIQAMINGMNCLLDRRASRGSIASHAAEAERNQEKR